MVLRRVPPPGIYSTRVKWDFVALLRTHLKIVKLLNYLAKTTFSEARHAKLIDRNGRLLWVARGPLALGRGLADKNCTGRTLKYDFKKYGGVMKQFLIAALTGLIILSNSSLVTSDDRASELANAYQVAKGLIGTKTKTMLASGSDRIIVAKTESADELVLIPITGLRGNPENFMSSFPGYSLSEKGIYSTRVYQCSWSDIQNKVVYECGESMKLPAGLREAVPEELTQQLQNVILAAAKSSQQTSLLSTR